MSAAGPHPSNRRIATRRRVQAGLSGILALSVVLACFAVDSLARTGEISEWIRGERQRKWARDDSIYWDRQLFVDPASRVILQDIPSADYSQGGVVLLGTSTLLSSLMTWELPEEQQQRIWNLAVGGATLTDQFNLVRYLVEHRDLLAAGGDQTEVILGLFFGDAVCADQWKFGYIFEDVFERHGLYQYDRESGIEPADTTRAGARLRMERAVCANFLQSLGASLAVSPERGLDVRAEFPALGDPQPDKYTQAWAKWMGPDWEPCMESELGSLAELVEYLQERDVHVSAVLMPLASWHAELPYTAAFERGVTELCSARGVELTNLSDLLQDSEFGDSSHPNFSGASKVHPHLARIAEQHLLSAGILDASER